MRESMFGLGLLCVAAIIGLCLRTPTHYSSNRSKRYIQPPRSKATKHRKGVKR